MNIGSLVAFAALHVAGYKVVERKIGRILAVAAVGAAICCSVMSCFQMSEFSSIISATGTVETRAGYFGLCVGVFATTSLVGSFLDLLQCADKVKPSPFISWIAALLSLVGIFSLRFGFYTIHMTAGIGL